MDMEGLKNLEVKITPFRRPAKIKKDIHYEQFYILTRETGKKTGYNLQQKL